MFNLPGFSGFLTENPYEAYGLRILGDIQAAANDTDDALVSYHEARTLADSLGMRPLIAMTDLRMGRLMERAGQSAKAKRHLDAARTLATELDMTLWEMPGGFEQG